jgi:O-antigen/teichoic acid export membrane protein
MVNTPHPKVSNLAATVGKATLFGIIGNVVQIATRFVTVPIVIHYLGLGGYGIWNIIMTVGAYMRFGSAGIKSAYQKYVAEATGNGEYQEANHLLSTGALVMLLISCIGLIPVAVFSRYLAAISGVPAEFLRSTASSISMLALFMVFANWGAVYESIVMGGHRIDLIRKIGSLTTIAEAVAIVIALKCGFGLFVMTAIMTVSELCFIVTCIVYAKRVVPEIQVRFDFVTRRVLGELIRFGGSYQLVNILEILYLAIIPIAVLKSFGDSAAGIYALVTRVVTSALMIQEAFLLPILSGGTMVFASGSQPQIRNLLAKSFKTVLLLSMPILAFTAVFGTLMISAWTGQSASDFPVACVLVALSSLFSALSGLQLVLYRASGNAVMDNIRQILRIATLLGVALFATKLGFFGVLGGLALSNFIGMVFMFYAMEKTFHCFDSRMIIPDAVRITLGTILIIAAGIVASHLPLPVSITSSGRPAAIVRLTIVATGCLVAGWPSMILTKAITTEESKSLLGGLVLRNRAKA